VGVIAGVGFAIGIVWPWLAGVRLAPSVPVEESETSPALSTSATTRETKQEAPPAAKADEKPPERTKTLTVEVGEAQIISCRDKDGNKKEDCDKIDFDSVAKPRLMALATCPAAKGAAQLLSIGFDLDFDKNEVRDITDGKSTTFGEDTTKELLTCAKKEFASAKLTDIDHENARYSIFYFLDFIPPGKLLGPAGAAEEEEELKEASGLATVSWDAALVRESPEDGAIKTRLRYGTRVVVSARKGKWYLVKYDSKGTKGWVHKNAIGL
jgi:hypothetical protein